MNIRSIPGIASIHMVNRVDLPNNCMLQSIGGAVVSLLCDAAPVSFIGEAVLSLEGTCLGSVRQEKATLTFSTLDKLPEYGAYAFVVTCVNGNQYLIGTREPRYPVVTYEETTGKLSGAAAVRTYKITHIAEKSVLEVVL